MRPRHTTAAAVVLALFAGTAFAAVEDPGAPAVHPIAAGTVGVHGATVLEGRGAARLAVVRGEGAPVRLRWTTRAGTAEAGADYEAGAGIVRFEPGEQVRTLEIPVHTDGEPENTETFRVVVESLPGLDGTHRSAAATVTIEG